MYQLHEKGMIVVGLCVENVGGLKSVRCNLSSLTVCIPKLPPLWAKRPPLTLVQGDTIQFGLDDCKLTIDIKLPIKNDPNWLSGAQLMFYQPASHQIPHMFLYLEFDKTCMLSIARINKNGAWINRTWLLNDVFQLLQESNWHTLTITKPYHYTQLCQFNPPPFTQSGPHYHGPDRDRDAHDMDHTVSAHPAGSTIIAELGVMEVSTSPPSIIATPAMARTTYI